MEKIDSFRGEYHFLSNFYFCEIRTSLVNGVFPSSEHLFQYLKAVNKEEALEILKAQHPAEAKKLGKKVTLRPDWKDIKVRVMKYVLKLKFDQNRILKAKLISTKGIELIEGNNWHDNFWGACSCGWCTNKPKRNMLGILLMELREAYINEENLNVFL